VVQLLVKAEADLDLQDQVSWLNPTVKYGIRAVHPVRFVSCACGRPAGRRLCGQRIGVSQPL
jgi:hypothetical protein